MTAALTLDTLKAIYKSLPAVPDEVEFHAHPESQNRYAAFFDAFKETNKSPFGGTLIPIKENIYLPISWGVLRNITKNTCKVVRYA